MRPREFAAVALVCLIAAVPAAAQSVERASVGPDAPAAFWAWASDLPDNEAVVWTIQSEGAGWTWKSSGVPLGQMLSPGVEAVNRKAVMVEVVGGRLAGISIRDLAQPADSDIRVLHYAGQISQQQSFDLLTSAQGGEEFRKDRIMAFGFHDRIPAAGRLIEVALDGGSVEERKAACYAYARFGGTGTLPRLTRVALEDASVEVGRAAAYAIGNVEDEASVEALRAVLDGPDRREVRKAAAYALGNLKLESARALLVHLIRTEQ